MNEKGVFDAQRIQQILEPEELEIFVSSPYDRSIQTINPVVEQQKQEIVIYEDLREREVGDFAPISFMEAKQRVYENSDFFFQNGESSREAQARAVDVIEHLLAEYCGKKIGIGTHGDIMTLIMNHYDPKYDYEFWQSTTMPDIYRLEFEKNRLTNVTRLWNTPNVE